MSKPLFRGQMFDVSSLRRIAPAPTAEETRRVVVGAHVRLNSGGPVAIVVDHPFPGLVTIAWRDDDGETRELDVPPECLRAI